MIIWLYKVFLTFNSTALMLVVFFANGEMKRILGLPKWGFVFGLCAIIFLMTRVSLLLSRFLSEDSIEIEIKELEAANNTFLPTYLGYFFVALSVIDVRAMIFVYGIVFIFTFISQAIYYNPLFLCFRYQFYYVTTENGVRCFIITKKKLRDKEDLTFSILRRINAVTYVDMEE